MKVYSVILQGSESTEQNAINFAQGFDFSESEVEEYNTRDKTYIDTINGIDIYYQYGADYYFFTDELINS